MNHPDTYHTPVMLDETLSLLLHRPGGTYLDCTLGGGGHFWAMAEKLDEKATLFGIDRDPDAVAWNTLHAGPSRARVIMERSRFSDFDLLLKRNSIFLIDGLLLDLGVSSRQIDDPGRGFSYQQKSSLDMRMDPSGGVTAIDFIGGADETELTDILRDYGEIQSAKKLARVILNRHRDGRLSTSTDLRDCVWSIFGAHTGVKIVAKLFQALRIAVNDELGELDRFLAKAVDHLKPGGRLAIIAYHSLEDRMVKEFIRKEEAVCACPPEAPICRCSIKSRLKRLTKKAIQASTDEIARNPRSRSARLRAAVRTEFAL